MLEEIADSMSTGGQFAAAIGLCAALLIVILRVRERSTAGRREPSGHPSTDAAAPAGPPEEPPSPASMTPVGDAAATPIGVSAEEKAADDRPVSAFKPYVPPPKT